MPDRHHWRRYGVFIINSEHALQYFTHWFGISNVDFEKVNDDWVPSEDIRNFIGRKNDKSTESINNPSKALFKCTKNFRKLSWKFSMFIHSLNIIRMPWRRIAHKQKILFVRNRSYDMAEKIYLVYNNDQVLKQRGASISWKMYLMTRKSLTETKKRLSWMN